MSDTACTLVRKETARKAEEIESFPIHPSPFATLVFFSSATHLRYILLFISYSLVRTWKRATRSRIHPQQLSIAEALSAVIGPWCHTMGQTMRGTIHPLLLETIRSSSPGAPTHLSTVDFSPLLESAHPANLINIIADYAAPRSQWELRAKRYRRYEAPALCTPPSPSVLATPNGLYIDRRAHRGFTHSRKTYARERKKKNCYSDDKRFTFIYYQI